MQRLGSSPPLFLSVVGQDPLAQFLQARFPYKENLHIESLEGCATATYTCILDHAGECLFGIGDMDIHKHITPQYVSTFQDSIEKSPVVVMDGNVPIETMDYVLGICQAKRVPVWFEPTDIHKAGRPFQTDHWRALSYISPNMQELRQMNTAVTGKTEEVLPPHENGKGFKDLDDMLAQAIHLSRPLLETVQVVVVTLGPEGILILRRSNPEAPFPTRMHPTEPHQDISAVHYPAIPVEKLVSVSGSGDCLAAAFVVGAIRRLPPSLCALAALKAAAVSLKSQYTVPDQLSYEVVFGEASNNRETIGRRVL